MATQEQPIYIDGFTSFELGINSGVAPLLLPKNQLSFGINTTVRGHYVTHRPPWRIATLSFPDQSTETAFRKGNFQGATYYKPDSSPESLVCSIAGRLYNCIPDSSRNIVISEITIPGDPNPASVTQNWLWQSEKWVIDNDGQSDPIFYDGTISRRSNAQQKVLGVVAVAGFTAPARGSTVIIPLNATFQGQIGDSFFIDSSGPSDGATYQATYPAAAPNATLTTLIDTSAGHSIGEQVVVNPNIMGVQATNVTFVNGGTHYAANTLDITLTLTQNYTAGIGKKVQVFGINWKVISFSGKFVLIQNQAAITLPAGMNAGLQIPFSSTSFPITVVGTLVSAFTTPSPASTVDIQMDNAYTGTNGAVVYVGTGQFTIAQKAAPPPGANVTAININDTPGNAVVSGDRLLSIPELPPGRMGVYGMGRNWVCLTDGRSFIGSDLVGSSSGTQVNQFRDAVLKTTQNLFLAGGGVFLVPGNIGNIQAMIFTATLDASLGQGPLQVFTPTVVFSVNAPVDNTTWQAIQNPILTESLIANGALAQNSTIAANGDTLFRAIDGVRSLILARREFSTWGNVPISHEMQRVIDQDDSTLLQYGSGVIFQNRMLMTSKPVSSGSGIFHEGLMALNFEPLASIGQKEPSVWDGLWTGVNVLQIITGTFSGLQRTFAFSYNNTLQQIEIYELLNDGDAIGDDNGNPIPIVWPFETACLFKNIKGKGEFDLCKLIDGELYVAEVAGRVSFIVQYRSQFDPCWHDWTSFSICATTGTDPTIQKQNRVSLGLGRPPVNGGCDPSNKRPFFIGETFQLRIKIIGHCKFYGALIKAAPEPKSFFTKPICDNEECRLLECSNEADYETYSLQDFTPLPPPKNIGNQAVFVLLCSESNPISFTGTLPAWISISGDGTQLIGAAATFFEATQAQANDAAQQALNDFVLEFQSSGALTCQSASCGTPTIIFIPDETGTPGTPTDAIFAIFVGSTIYLMDSLSNFFTSSDGINWTFTGNQAPIQTTSFAYDGISSIVAVGFFFGGGQTSLSLDNTATWTVHSIGNSSTMFAVAFGAGVFVTVGANGDVATSSNGITWSLQNLTGGSDLSAVIFAAGQFITVGDSGTIYTSPDGTTWTSQTSGTATDLTGITYGNGTYVVVGASTVLSSADGISWSTLAAAPANFLSIAFNEGNFVAAVISTNDNPDGAYYSTDANSWTPVTTTPPPPDSIFQCACVLPIGNCQFVVCENIPPT